MLPLSSKFPSVGISWLKSYRVLQMMLGYLWPVQSVTSSIDSWWEVCNAQFNCLKNYEPRTITHTIPLGGQPQKYKSRYIHQGVDRIGGLARRWRDAWTHTFATYMAPKHSVATSISALVGWQVIQSCNISFRELAWGVAERWAPAYFLLIVPNNPKAHF